MRQPSVLADSAAAERSHQHMGMYVTTDHPFRALCSWSRCKLTAGLQFERGSVPLEPMTEANGAACESRLMVRFVCMGGCHVGKSSCAPRNRAGGMRLTRTTIRQKSDHAAMKIKTN